eukprot:CAMPEP_0171306308 /NCGR_PEP_ID=MMETSP0816-20121228/16300_1 /TAXON_ID=420281 /ORGANISM="Proboscia inermis, Strain CCAP1064/1" /LENGTH=188 /DNA_ID=CAMNT_0011787793 /DNA_START=162 /DNA_END=726 /DNA_ORIENTATION=+
MGCIKLVSTTAGVAAARAAHSDGGNVTNQHANDHQMQTHLHYHGSIGTLPRPQPQQHIADSIHGGHGGGVKCHRFQIRETVRPSCTTSIRSRQRRRSSVHPPIQMGTPGIPDIRITVPEQFEKQQPQTVPNTPDPRTATVPARSKSKLTVPSRGIGCRCRESGAPSSLVFVQKQYKLIAASNPLPGYL